MKIVVTILSASVLLLAFALFRYRPFPAFTQYEGPAVSGPLALTDLDEVEFTCDRSRTDRRRVSLRWHDDRKSAAVESVIWDRDGQVTTDSTRDVSAEEARSLFRDFEQQLMRAEIFEASLHESMQAQFDGSTWSISGRKGGLVVTHQRRNAPRSDPAMLGLGLRLLRLGGIEISPDKIY